METIFYKTDNYQTKGEYKYIDYGNGLKIFDGNISQYKNMLTLFDKLTLDEYIIDITKHLKNDETNEVFSRLTILSEAAKINEIHRFSMICETFKIIIEKYEQKIKTPLEVFEEYKIFLDEFEYLKNEIEQFTEKQVSYNAIKKIRGEMKRSLDNKMGNNNLKSSPIERSKYSDERKTIFGNMEKKFSPYDISVDQQSILKKKQYKKLQLSDENTENCSLI